MSLDRYDGKYIDREYVNGQWAGIKAGPMPVAYTGSINDPDKIRNTSLIIPSSSEGAPSVSSNPNFAVTTIRYGEDAYIQQAIDLKSMNTYLRLYNGTSWGGWVAGNDNTSVDSKINSLQSQINSLGTRVTTASSNANSALTKANTNANSISSINSKNSQQDSSISAINNNVQTINTNISNLNSKLNSRSGSMYCKPGEVGSSNPTSFNTWTSGVLEMTRIGFSDKFYKQDISNFSLKSQNSNCYVYDFTFNGKMTSNSGTGFVWSYMVPFLHLIKQIEGKDAALINFNSWPSVEIVDSTGKAWYVTGSDEKSGLFLYTRDDNPNALYIGRAYGSTPTPAAFAHNIYTRNSPSKIVIKGTVNAII